MSLDCDADSIQAWLHARSGLPLQRDFYGIARRVDNEIVAAFGFDSFQPNGCQLHLGSKPHGLTRGLLQAVFRTAFMQWKFKYLAAIIQTTNAQSIHIAGRLGFKPCGQIPGELYFGVLYANDCRWLGECNVRRRKDSECTGSVGKHQSSQSNGRDRDL
jgi:RimJ/RimL family protein N-acetyltransferase